jgi:FkbM family methyltransferase
MSTELFRRYAIKDATSQPGTFTNFLGVASDCGLFINGAELSGKFLAGDPIPNDGVAGTAGEYLSVLEAIANAQAHQRQSFSMIELGAGWGPWVSNAGVVCRREGFTEVFLTAIEADPVRFDSLTNHMLRNGLFTKANLVLGAVWDREDTLYFPKCGLGDHGGSANTDQKEYRGAKREMQKVRAYRLPTLAEGMGTIDLIHCDIQGAEARVAEANPAWLTQHVLSIQIGTHSRDQEGRLLELFHSQGWDLIRETPCQYSYRRDCPSLEGMTTTDGELYFRNPKLW